MESETNYFVNHMTVREKRFYDYTKIDFEDLCGKINKNDISYKILMKHNKHIVEQNMESLIKYYTLSGSYYIN